MHADSPHRSWPEASRLLERGRELDVALLDLPLPERRIHSYRSRLVEGVRAVVHGHESVEKVERSANRLNLDTGAGIRHLNRLSLLEPSAPELHSLTFGVDEG